jgi:hypothetical protein
MEENARLFLNHIADVLDFTISSILFQFISCERSPEDCKQSPSRLVARR